MIVNISLGISVVVGTYTMGTCARILAALVHSTTLLRRSFLARRESRTDGTTEQRELRTTNDAKAAAKSGLKKL